MLKYIFTVLLLIAVWTTVWLLALSWLWAIIASVVIVAVLITVVVVQLVRARRAAREIERALAAQADQHAARARPDLAADVQALKVEFVKALEALKKSKLAGVRSSEALYALPWYVIIGPPGSGKTTALRESGLRFPYMSQGGAVAGVGGTRNCQWWMSNKAVILDTAGRYTTEDADHEEWLSFLELLKKNRPKAPVNGVLAAVSLADFLHASRDDAMALARDIRTRVDEVMGRLEMVVPVYVLFTKCDLVPGFVELFEDLGANERHQIWGFTFPAAQKIPDAGAAFRERFDELSDIVERRALRRMGEERRLEARHKIYAFPQHFGPLADTLTTFVGELMAENIYAESPVMRGCYFTSGTQEGSPVDRIMGAMAQAFGIAPRLSMTEQAVEAKSYFLGEVFEKVVFPDKVIAHRTAKHVRRRKLIVHSIAIALIMVAFGLAVLPVASFQRNKEMLGDARGAVNGVNDHFLAKEKGEKDEIIRLATLRPLREIQSRLGDYESGGPPVLMRMGMYKGSQIQAELRQLYYLALREELVEKLHRFMLHARLDEFVQDHAVGGAPAPRQEHEGAKRMLRTYLLLTGPPKSSEPSLGSVQQTTWVAQHLTELWKEALRNLEDDSYEDIVGVEEEMNGMIATYVGILAEDPGKRFKRDDKLVQEVREILLRTDQADEILTAVLDGVEEKDKDLFALTGSRISLKHRGQHKIRGRFTRRAWERHVRDRLYSSASSMLGDDEWVLDRSKEKAAEMQRMLMARVRDRYFGMYIQEWEDFLGAIIVPEPGNSAEALDMLKELTRGKKPLTGLLQNVAHHTALKPPPPPPPPAEEGGGAGGGAVDALKAGATKQLDKKVKGAGGLVDGVGGGGAGGAASKPEILDPTLKTEKDVRVHFEKLASFGWGGGAGDEPAEAVPLDSYHTELESLHTALDEKLASEGDAERKALEKAVRTATSATESLITGADLGEWHPTIQKWLRPPIRAVEKISARETGVSLADAWCQQVVLPYDDLKGFYPFNGKATKGATLDAFTEFFAPESGQVWSFYKSSLESRVTKTHRGYSPAKAGRDERNKLNPKVTDFLNRAADVSEAVFTESGEAKFEFRVLNDGASGAGVERTEFAVDGQQHTYRNTPLDWIDMTWPGPDSPKGGFIRTTGTVGRTKLEFPGDWGFFQLLEAGTTKDDASTPIFTFRWDLRDAEAGIVKIKFEPKIRDTPLFGTARRPTTLMGLFRHADLVPPRQLFVGGKSCSK